MATKEQTRQAVEFLEAWFEFLEPTVGFRKKYQVSIRGAKGPQTISLPISEWLGNLGGDTDHFTSLVDAFSGTVKVFPWYLAPNKGVTAVGSLTAETEPEKRKAMPGVWVDLAGSYHKQAIYDFATYLDRQGGIGPTFITGNDMDGTLPYFNRGRLWWRVDWGTAFPPYKVKNSHTVHAAWGMHIQRLAIRFGLCTGLPVCGDPTFDEQLYDLPGTGGVSIIHRTGFEPISHAKIDWATDNRLEAIEEMFKAFAPSITADGFLDQRVPLWDEILKPQGWRPRGMGTEAGVTWWSAPGSDKEMTAYTRGDLLYLRTPNWLSGLKEASDAGIPLNKWTVACILGWDGDHKAFRKHLVATGTLY